MGGPVTAQMMPFIQSCAKRRDTWLDKKPRKNNKTDKINAVFFFTLPDGRGRLGLFIRSIL